MPTLHLSNLQYELMANSIITDNIIAQGILLKQPNHTNLKCITMLKPNTDEAEAEAEVSARKSKATTASAKPRFIDDAEYKIQLSDDALLAFIHICRLNTTPLHDTLAALLRETGYGTRGTATYNTAKAILTTWVNQLKLQMYTDWEEKYNSAYIQQHPPQKAKATAEITTKPKQMTPIQQYPFDNDLAKTILPTLPTHGGYQQIWHALRHYTQSENPNDAKRSPLEDFNNSFGTASNALILEKHAEDGISAEKSGSIIKSVGVVFKSFAITNNSPQMDIDTTALLQNNQALKELTNIGQLIEEMAARTHTVLINEATQLLDTLTSTKNINSTRVEERSPIKRESIKLRRGATRLCNKILKTNIPLQKHTPKKDLQKRLTKQTEDLKLLISNLQRTPVTSADDLKTWEGLSNAVATLLNDCDKTYKAKEQTRTLLPIPVQYPVEYQAFYTMSETANRAMVLSTATGQNHSATNTQRLGQNRTQHATVESKIPATTRTDSAEAVMDRTPAP
mgnify:CR=1 FL=1